RLLDVPEQHYLMVDGHGDPNASPGFAEAIETLYPVAYGLKFASKNDLGRDYVVPPLEGLWWAEDMASFTTARDKTRWSWTLMLLVPEWLGAADVDAACAGARAKADAKSTAPPPRLDELRLQSLAEGRCAQTLHVGPFDAEGPVLTEMHTSFIPDQGLALAGTHHEIYLSDVRKTAPEKLRTILRQPVRPA
ncbi:GyrI-like domain-containing protein, partial [Dietzia timorensis]